MKKLTIMTAVAIVNLATSADVVLPNTNDLAQAVNTITNEIHKAAQVPAIITEQFCTVNITLNPNGVQHELPTDPESLDALLKDAKIVAIVDGIGEIFETSVDELENFKTTLYLPITQGKTMLARIQLWLGNSSYVADDQIIPVRAKTTKNIDIETFMREGAIYEICRAQPSGSYSQSFVIKKETTDGHIRTTMGYFVGNQWHSMSEVKFYVDECHTNEEGTAIVERVYLDEGGGGTNAKDIDYYLNCIGGMKEVSVAFTGVSWTVSTTLPLLYEDEGEDPNSRIINKYMRYPQLWVKTTVEDIPVLKYTDISMTTVVTNITRCVCKWYCNSQADPDYQLHPLFVRYIRDPENNTYTEKYSDYGYIARYAGTIGSIKHGGTATYNCLLSRADKTVDTGTSRLNYQDSARNNNQMNCLVVCPGEETKVLHAYTDNRRFAMTAWGKDVSFLQWLSFLCYDINIQTTFGIAHTDGNPYNGESDWMFKANVRCGRTPEKNKEMLLFGIEGGLHMNWGWMVADLTHFCIKGETQALNDHSYLYARDRNDYDVMNADYYSYSENGYSRIPVNIKSNTYLLWCDDNDYTKTLMLFGDGTNQGNLNTGGVDNYWIGQGSASTPVGGIDAYMVALGIDRGNGAYLGSFSLHAYRGLSFGYGNAWRSRASLELFNEANDE